MLCGQFFRFSLPNPESYLFTSPVLGLQAQPTATGLMNQLFFILSLWLQLGEQTKAPGSKRMVRRGRKKKPLFLRALSLASSLFSPHTLFSGRKGYLYTPVGSGGGGPPILQRGSFTSQNPGPEGDGGNLQFTLHRPKTATPENCELTAWLSNKNENPTLHFRPVNRAVCAGEVFRCALRPPSWS